VRELENVIEGAIALTTDPIIDPGDLLLPEGAAANSAVSLPDDFPTLDELQGRYIARVLTQTRGNISKAARILGVDRKTLYRRREDLPPSATDDDKWDIH